MEPNEVFYVLKPDKDEENIIFNNVDWKEVFGYVFKKVYTNKSGTIYLRSMYPEFGYVFSTTEQRINRGKTGFHYVPNDNNCACLQIPETGNQKINKCQWYCKKDGTCFLHGAGCSPEYIAFGAEKEWDI